MSRLSQFIPNVTNVALTTFSGTGTFTKNSSDLAYIVQVWGGGGSGSSSTAVSNRGAAGGGGGAYNEAFLYASGLPSTISIVIGAGGLPVSGSATPGNTGGTSSFGNYVLAYGGGGGGSPTGTFTLGGGGGGTLSGPSLNEGGRPRIVEIGSSTNNLLISNDNSMGGGSTYIPDISYPNSALAGSSYFGGAAGATIAVSPGIVVYSGGTSLYGGGGGGCVYNIQTGPSGVSYFGGSGGAGSSTLTGNPGSVPAGGGGGTYSSGAGTSGAGARGEVRVYAFRGKPQ